jgi:hypothetical protein
MKRISIVVLLLALSGWLLHGFGVFEDHTGDFRDV